MTAAPLSVTPQVLADVLDALGRRPRAKLDSDAQLGSDWPIEHIPDGLTVTAGEQAVLTVRPDPAGAVTALSQLRCSCLVEGPCLHLAAYLRHLPVRGQDQPADTSNLGTSTSDHPDESQPAEAGVGPVDVSPEVRAAASLAWDALGAVLLAGARRCGVLETARLLRAAQVGRTFRLYRLEGALLAVVESLSRLSRSDPSFTLEELTGQVLETARCSHHLRAAVADPSWWGTARREFVEAPAELVHGAGAERVDRPGGDPALRVHLWGRSGWSHLQARPAPAAELAGGYTVPLGADGTLPRPDQLSRRQAHVVGAARSADGRLGGGSSVRVQLREPGSVGSVAFDSLWDQPVTDQVARALTGGGLVAIAGTVRGANREGVVLDTDGGPMLLIRPAAGRRSRTNLSVLASAPGLDVRVLGRPDQARARVLWPVAVTGAPGEPRWNVPADWAGLVNLAFDDLRASYLGVSSVSPVGADIELPLALTGGLEPLERRVGRVVLGGRVAVRANSASVRADVQRLRGRGLTGAADLLHALANVPAAPSELANAWLAAAVYAATARQALLTASW